MSVLNKLFQAEQWKYQLAGISKRFSQSPTCPSCSEGQADKVDSKGAYSLLRCEKCKLLYRFPYETAEEMDAFYQKDYEQPGLTTDLPDDESLKEMLSVDFKGTGKDFTTVIELFQALGMGAGSRVLDFGANWGYATHQFRKAGYETDAYELARDRAKFAEKLGIQIETDKAQIASGYDIVYSSHVLEHVPSPTETIREMLGWTRPGGFVVAHTPNGSAGRRKVDYEGFHRNWGKVHPVLLTDEYLETTFAEDHQIFAFTEDDARVLAGWDKSTHCLRDCEGFALFFAIQK